MEPGLVPDNGSVRGVGVDQGGRFDHIWAESGHGSIDGSFSLRPALIGGIKQQLPRSTTTVGAPELSFVRNDITMPAAMLPLFH